MLSHTGSFKHFIFPIDVVHRGEIMLRDQGLSQVMALMEEQNPKALAASKDDFLRRLGVAVERRWNEIKEAK